MERDEIIQAINDERDRQDREWGGADHDDEHGPADWVAFMLKQLLRAPLLDPPSGTVIQGVNYVVDHVVNMVWTLAGARVNLPATAGNYRKRLIRVAALAVAAIESFDRLQAAARKIRRTGR